MLIYNTACCAMVCVYFIFGIKQSLFDNDDSLIVMNNCCEQRLTVDAEQAAAFDCQSRQQLEPKSNNPTECSHKLLLSTRSLNL